MQAVAFDDFTRNPRDFDAAVAATPGVDRFCSSSDWILAANAAFHRASKALVARFDSGWLALGSERHPGLGVCLSPLEAMWGLACPLAGADPEALGRDAAAALAGPLGDWTFLRLSGLPAKSRLLFALAAPLSRRFAVSAGTPVVRWSASLAGGAAGWLSRRTRKFRANLRSDRARARKDGVACEFVERAADPAALYERLLQIESKSWKGREGTGFLRGDMREFYRVLVKRLAAAGRLRAMVGTRRGEDVAFQFGGVLGDTYRGFQISFDDRFRNLGLGNVMQAEMIERLAEAGLATYDLGVDMEYKSHWAEKGIETVSLFALNKPTRTAD